MNFDIASITLFLVSVYKLRNRKAISILSWIISNPLAIQSLHFLKRPFPLHEGTAGFYQEQQVFCSVNKGNSCQAAGAPSQGGLGLIWHDLAVKRLPAPSWNYVNSRMYLRYVCRKYCEVVADLMAIPAKGFQGKLLTLPAYLLRLSYTMLHSLSHLRYTRTHTHAHMNRCIHKRLKNTRPRTE